MDYPSRWQPSSLERSGDGGGLQCSPTLSADRESIAVSSGSDSGNATLPSGGSAAKSSSPEASLPSDAIDILSSEMVLPNGAMHWRSERSEETHSTGKLSL